MMNIRVIQPPYPKRAEDTPASVAYMIEQLRQCDESMDLILLPECCNAPSCCGDSALLRRLVKAHTQPLLDAARGCGLTLHRCIDVSRDPLQTYRDAAACGIDTVLTSGAAANCAAGQEMLARLLKLRDETDGPEVLIGAGVKAEVIRQLRRSLPGARAFHASCKTEVESGMRFRRDGVPMGLPGLDEWHIQQTSEAAVRLARAALEETR